MKKLIEAIKKLFGKSDKPSSDSSSGFTLIELLVVIAVIGVLAAAVLIAIDPLQQLARGRDSGRKSSISQVGNAVQAYYTANSAYPAILTWSTDLVNTSELKIFPTDPGGSVTAPGCTAGNIANGLCYKFAGADFVVYSHMESNSEKRKGTCAGVDLNTWYVYSSMAGKAGIVCQAAQPAPGTSYTFY